MYKLPDFAIFKKNMADNKYNPTIYAHEEDNITLGNAILLAETTHEGQEDKANTSPYIEHCKRVMHALEPYRETVQIVGILHDTIEDTWITPEYLRGSGYLEEIIEAILSVSKSDQDASYETLIYRSKNNPIGRIVKLADNLDNSNERRLEALPDEQAERFRAKYEEAREILLKDDDWLADQCASMKERIERLVGQTSNL